MKKQKSNTEGRIAGAAVAVLALSLGVIRADVSSNLHRVFPVSPGGQLVVRVDQGSIEVTARAGRELEVQVLRTVTRASDKKAREVLAAHQVSLEQAGSKITVSGRLDRSAYKRNWLGWGPELRVRYVITAPTNFNLDLGTSAGSVRVDACAGEVSVKTSAGSIRLGQCEGPANLQTSAGSIRVGQAAGALKARTSAGSIEVESARSAVEAISSAGSIEVGFEESPDAECELRTAAGSVTVRLPEKPHLRVDAQTSAGSVHCDAPVQREGPSKKTHLVGRLGEGGPLLKIRTSAGSIHIKE